MSESKFALLGNWSFIPGKPKGISVYRFDAATGALEHQETVLDDLYAGQQYYNPATGVDYVVNEIGHRRGEQGGGGYVLALKVDPETGKVTLLNEQESLAPEPSYLYLDKSGKYLIVVHHIDSGHVTKISKENGKYVSRTLFDDAAIVLFAIHPDGSIGDAVDVQIVQGAGDDSSHAIPHLHSVVADPTGELYVICDKGTDRIYALRIDRENGKLVQVSVTVDAEGSAPRYLAYHPTLPLLYVNHERNTRLSVFRYEIETGITELAQDLELLLDPEAARGIERVEASDVIVSPDAKTAYVCIRGVNLISVMRVDDEGKATVVQNVACNGDPRGLTLSPDGRFLYACNMMAGSISTFAVAEDGSLTFLNNDTKGVSPANLVFV